MIPSNLILILFIIGKSMSQEPDKKYGPFQLPKWDTTSFSDRAGTFQVKTVTFPETISGKIFSARAWRMAFNYNFLASYKSEENYYSVIPEQNEINEWYQKNQCLVGTDLTETHSNDCWESLDKTDRTEWINPKPLKIDVPSATAFRSTCTRRWSCSIHDVHFPLYTSAGSEITSVELYFSGPDGKRYNVFGTSTEKTGVRIQDSVFIYENVMRKWDYKNIDGQCIGNGETLLCNVMVNKKQITLKFNKDQHFATFNNILFYKPTANSKKQKRDIPNPSRPATMGDLEELSNKLMMENTNSILEYHEITREVLAIKNYLRELTLSVSKIDDHLLGKLMKIPARSIWLNEEHFILTGSQENFINNAIKGEEKNCLDTYVYDNGRWRLQHETRPKCISWNNTVVLPVLINFLEEPLLIKDAPEFREDSSSYEGWTFLDNGRISLDFFDPSVKYKGTQDFFGGILGGINISFYLNIIILIILGTILIKILLNIILKK